MAKRQFFMRILTAVFAAAFAFAFIAGTARAAKAEGDGSFMTLEEYEAGVLRVNEAFSPYLQDDSLTEKIQSAYFLVNYAYISEELYAQLVEKGYIPEVDMLDEDGEWDMDNPDGWMNIDNFSSLKNEINDYNERQIHFDYIDGTMDVSHYIDPSVLCAEERDREAARQLFENWFNGYTLKRDTIAGNESFGEAHAQLIALATTDSETNVSVGARWLMLQTTGLDLMQFLRDYLFDNYHFDELELYFDPEEIQYGQLFLKDDIKLDPNNLSDLEYAVYCFGQEWNACLNNVNDDIFAALNADELIRQD